MLSGFGALAGTIPKGALGDAGLAFMLSAFAASFDLLSATELETGDPTNGELRAGRVFWRPKGEDVGG